MAEEHKKSFLLYFDTYDCVAALPAEQRGELILLLFRYAIAVEAAPTEPEAFLADAPITGETKMAFRFLAESIRRDTEKWKAKQKRYQAAAARRAEDAVSGRRRSGRAAQDDDHTWMRRYLTDREAEEPAP